MNQSKIEWCDVTINPIVGCSHGCDYCYARRMSKRFKHQCKDCYTFKPHPHLERLDQITSHQKAKKVFINSMWDFCDKTIEYEWLLPIHHKMVECKQHTFMILTKKPKLYVYTFPKNHFIPKLFPKNVWIGATCDGRTQNQVEELASTKLNNIKFISFEPLLHPINNTVLNDLYKIDWIIIGAETGNRKDKVKCNRAWVERIREACEDFKKPIFMKDNLCKEGVYCEKELIQKFPDRLKMR